MPFIGNQPALAYTSFAKQDFTTSATTSYTLDNPVTNENEIALFINFVRQEPTTAYTASGTSLTLTSATSASDDMYCVFLGKAVQTVNPPAGSVGTSQLEDASVTSAKLASGVLPTNTPAFFVYQASAQSIANATETLLQYETELFDTDSCYDNATNYRFTPTTAGKYLLFGTASIDTSTNADTLQIRIRKNGTTIGRTRIFNDNTGIAEATTLAEANGTTDYFDCTIYQNTGSTNNTSGSNISTRFGGYKIIE